ncbi:hypothetical protein [Ruegeria sp. HKCCD8929]|uniref:hypothetical protein n=1 Tax=Ruegeria sp. HKCCD8929 TaxID=2683006 RepID=UPI001487BBD5|nr:hypothetical protein [Ruegeria sp. HKCCD8929]
MIFRLALGLILMATSTIAEELSVRSGEHKDFTRLVIKVPEGTSWTLDPSDNGARLNVELPDVTYDIDSVFGRLSQNRLLFLEQEKPGDGLDIGFACNCVANGFLHAGAMIVIDIRKSKDKPSAPPVLPLARPKPQKTLHAAHGNSLPIPEQAPKTGSRALPNPAPSLKTAQTGQEIETQLLTQILKGTDQEVLDLDLAAVGPRQSGASLQTALERTLNLHNIAVGTVVDRDLTGDPTGVSLLESETACISDNVLDFASWSDGTSFSAQIADARSNLFGEFDRLDRGQALRLAKLFAYFGFGAEAEQILELADHSSDESSMIRAVAAAVEKPTALAENPFAGQQRCGGDAALWATLTEGHVAEDADTRAIELAFLRLPDHLATHLGPELARLLTKAGQLEAARRVLRAVERAGVNSEAAMALVEAELASAEENPDTEENKLKDAVEAEQATAEAPLALIRLIGKRWEEQGVVSGKEVELAAAFALEYRRSELGDRLKMAHVLAMALNQQFDEAMGTLFRVSDNRPRKMWGQTLERVALAMTERADDITFLRHTLGLNSDLISVMPDDTIDMIAGRLVSLGFHETALSLAGDQGVKREARAMILARAALETGRPHRAVLEIEGYTTPAASLVRADAMYASGNYAAAAEHASQMGDNETATRYLWLADAWDRVSGEADTKYPLIVGLSRNLSAQAAHDTLPPLAKSKRLLEKSTQTREMVGELMRQFD